MKDKSRFLIGVSVEGYKCKEEAIGALSRNRAKEFGLRKMSFIEKEVTLSEFVELVVQGHSFCGLFDAPKEKVWRKVGGRWCYTSGYYQRGKQKGSMKLSFKCDAYYRGAQAIFVDIDETKYSSHTKFIEKLECKPTVAYYTYSDGGYGYGRRFRLVYILDRVYGADNIRVMSEAITQHIEEMTGEKMKDKCGLKLSQYFNGNWQDRAIYRNDKAIFSIKNEELKIKNSKTSEPDTDGQWTVFGEGRPCVDEEMIEAMKHESYSQFMWNYGVERAAYRVYFRTQYEWEKGQKYRVLCAQDEYLKLHYHRHALKDGEQRRNTLIRKMCLRRIMKPEVSVNELIYNGYYDIYHIIDMHDEADTDKPFESRKKIAEWLVAKAEAVITESMEVLRERYSGAIDYYREHRPKIVINDMLPNKRSEVAAARRQETDNEIGYMYDTSLSVRDNWLIMKEMGIAKSLNRLYEWCRRYGIDTHVKSLRKTAVQEDRAMRNERLAREYDLGLTEKANAERLGISASMAHRIKEKKTTSPSPSKGGDVQSGAKKREIA